MKILLLTPPMTQLNTPYPATSYLAGCLRANGVQFAQVDASIDWALRILSREGLTRIADDLNDKSHFVRHRDEYVSLVEPVVRFLQGKDDSLAQRIAARKLLPEGRRFKGAGPSGHEDEYLAWAFGHLGTHDRAKYFASLFLEDIADAIVQSDPHFGFSRYAEKIAASAPSLDPLLAALSENPPTAQMLDELTKALVQTHAPSIVAMSIPFPGNVLGALRMAKIFREHGAKIWWGGGYVNTELRTVSDPRLFDFIDALTYDDGETPILQLLAREKNPEAPLLRTRTREGYATSELQDIPFAASACPTYEGLHLGNYLSIVDTLNPMHRLWSDQRWNKLTVAHGCYWKKCNFCDISLDYISRYEPLAAVRLVDHIEALIGETGTRGFHFVDEAAPPAGLKALAEELLKRNLQISWWGNIRFEKTFTPALCALLAKSGCIAVSGGLEVASNRLLALMQKGVTVEQVARVTKAFSGAGILVHAYLMYGFPTETEKETVDSLEMVRQLFAEGCIDSAYWHRFSATTHSPIGLQPKKFGITLHPKAAGFAENDLDFSDPTGTDHTALGEGLRAAVFNYMHGLALEDDTRRWFKQGTPKPSVPKNFIKNALNEGRF